MKNIITYDQFLNEGIEPTSIRDKMIPKSPEEIKSEIDKLPVDDKLDKILSNKLQNLYTANEMESIIDSMNPYKKSMKEVQNIQSILLSNRSFDSYDTYKETGIDCHTIYHDKTFAIYYVSTGMESLQFGILPSIEAIVMNKDNGYYYIDVNNNYLAKYKPDGIDFIYARASDFGDKLREWNDFTLENNMDNPKEIKPEDVSTWYSMLNDMVNSLGNRKVNIIESGEQIPELR